MIYIADDHQYSPPDNMMAVGECLTMTKYDTLEHNLAVSTIRQLRMADHVIWHGPLAKLKNQPSVEKWRSPDNRLICAHNDHMRAESEIPGK